MHPFFEGVVAGYGIAIPVGAIAVLIIEISLRGGFWPGFFAGAGAASADIFYALIAAVTGTIVSSFLSPYSYYLQLASGLLLLALGGWGLWLVNKNTKINPKNDLIVGHGLTYFKFLGLTILNPLTVVYFGALILGGNVINLNTLDARYWFVFGAGLASLSWQTLLAIVGALAKQHLSPRFQSLTRIIGNLVVLGLGVRILFNLGG